ncbi:hypothetical protein NMY22_g3248 [Coprinellus aureogranulatus]|nr:hypothetical protein NMY22_g3248 [Coprinellus aureogranulatus]
MQKLSRAIEGDWGPLPLLRELMTAPIQRVIQEVKDGSPQAMVILQSAIDANYAEHPVAILDALLVHLRQSPALVQVQHTIMALAAMKTLSGVFRWHHNHPEPTPASIAAANMIRDSVDDFVYWLTRLLEHLPEELNEPAALDGYNTTGRFIYTVFLAFPDIQATLVQSTPILMIGVYFCYRLHQGAPIVYPGGRPSDPLCDEPDPGSGILFQLAKDNPVGLAKVVSDETVCSRQSLSGESSIGCEFTSEKLNINWIIGATDRLMDYDTALRELFREERAPEVYVEALAIQLRLAVRLPDAHERISSIVNMSIAPMKWWDSARATNVVSRAGDLVDAGIFSLMGSLLPVAHVRDKFDAEDDGSGFQMGLRTLAIRCALGSIMPYILHPSVLAKSAQHMRTYIEPSLEKLPPDSPYNEFMPSNLLYLQNCERLLPREQQEALCDNPNHWNITSMGAKYADQIEKVCSRCHSVAYCSRVCQKEDWNTFHREECAHMALEYYNRKSSKLWYPYSTRRFHANILRYTLESLEVGKAIIGSEGPHSMWTFQNPYNVSDAIDPLNVMNNMCLCYGQDLNTWVGSISTLIPDHLRPRFDLFLRLFLPSLGIPRYTPGSVRLLEKAFRMGGEDVRLVILLCQGYAMPTIQGTKDQRVDMAKRFSIRDPKTTSYYQFLGSFAFYGNSGIREGCSLIAIVEDCARLNWQHILSYSVMSLEGLHLAFVHISKVVEFAKAGSIVHVRHLKDRIVQDYAEHGADILDAVLTHLKPLSTPEDETIDEDRESQHAPLVVASMIALTEIARWTESQTTRTPISISTSLRVFSASQDYIACALRLLTNATTQANMLHHHHVVASLLYTLLRANPRLLPTLANNTDMLDLSIVFWVTLYKGLLLLYPEGKPSGVPLVDETGDQSLSIFHRITMANPGGMAKAVQDMRVCDIQFFTQQSVDRMQSVVYTYNLPNLSHLKEPTVELANSRYVIQSLNVLIKTDRDLRAALLAREKHVEIFISGLGTMSKRLCERNLPDDMQQMESRLRHLDGILELAECVVNWVATTSTNIVRNMRRIIDSGAIQIIGYCVPFVADQQHSKVDSIYATLLSYALYPHNMRIFVSAMSELVTPQLEKTPDSSYRKGSMGSNLMFLNPFRSFLEEGEQRPLCDNLNHQAHVGKKKGDTSSTERICSLCHTVAYCSKRCQAEDWKLLHHAECASMAREYNDRNPAGSLYRYRYRKFHANILCYAFESGEVLHRTFQLDLLTGARDNPSRVHTDVEILWEDNDVQTGNDGTPLNEYLRKTSPQIAAFMRPRFEALTSVFRKWAVRAGRNTSRNSDPFVVGSMRLMERAFRFGEIDVMLVLLLEQIKPLPVVTGTAMEKDRKLTEFTRRGAKAASSFKILGSMTYTTPRRSRREKPSEEVERVIRSLAQQQRIQRKDSEDPELGYIGFTNHAQGIYLGLHIDVITAPSHNNGVTEELKAFSTSETRTLDPGEGDCARGPARQYYLRSSNALCIHLDPTTTSYTQRSSLHLRGIAMRKLSLHASALTDDEYTLYTHALKELAEIDVNQPQLTGGQGADGDDEYYEGITLGVREVRAWLRGRYAGKIEVGVMDNNWALTSKVDLEVLFAHPRCCGCAQRRSILRCAASGNARRERSRTGSWFGVRSS